ncbi:TIGR03032 family protein [Solimonas terrae]|uniref:TIGR03032 family protein n=1 Tax=Solimonas terrae TaxID=1396819 RepID=A0A6M2BRC0_9GAMM|nr:TIGR03032 family protein [Solimonas terrae]NGY04880.1 TIGR03032 family protein [Solimonas terrae]
MNDDSTLQCRTDPGFSAWLAAAGGSLAVTTYQAHKLLLIGWNGRQLSFLPRHFERPMGLDLRDGRLLLACQDRVTLFADDPVLGHHYDDAQPGRYDALYLPRLSWHAAGLDVHDVALTDDASWIVATRFSCLATLSDRYSFVPRWRPRFVGDDAPEDRCHLNGMAMRDGRPAFVTCLAETDTRQGWRAQRRNGGALLEVDSGDAVLRGLSMPHSPRWHEGALWLLESGAGRLLRVDTQRGTADEVCALPGYLRGLDLVGPYALVGLCKARESEYFGDLAVQARHRELRCGVAVIDTRSGAQVGFFELSAGASEIYDLRFIAGRQRVNVLNTQSQERRVAFSAPPDLHWWTVAETDHV